MARIVVPLTEAIQIFQANVQVGDIISRIDATENGPRLAVRLTPITRAFFITIRYAGFDSGVAWFTLDGVPAFVNLGSILKLPRGISISGSTLKINTDQLIRNELGLKGLAVRSVAWQNGAYVIETGTY